MNYLSIFTYAPFGVFALTMLTFVWRLKVGVRAQAIWAMVLLLAFAKFLCFSQFGGHAFSPELPEVLIWAWDFLYSGAMILFALSVVFIFRFPGKKWLLPVAAWGLSLWGLVSGIVPPRVVEREFAFANLPPSLDGYRIVQLSDLHCSSAARLWRTERVVKAINSLDADLVCITGDLADGRVAKIGRELKPLADLRARDGIFACTGNHEYYHDYFSWRSQFYNRVAKNIRFLDNECAFPRPGLAVAGVPDLAGWERGGIADYPDVREAFASATNNEFRILLQHRPKHAPENFGVHDVALQLSGHTHGGIAPIMDRLVAAHNGGFVRGESRIGDSVLFVSPGAGQWAGFPMRFFNPSEITVITLRKRPTEVMFFFDTEDYTSDRANDAVMMIANTFNELGVRGHFAIVGYLAQKWMDYGRKDIVEALKPHLIGTQTMYHSVHPNILEMADEKDFAVAYSNIYVQEKMGCDLIRKALGRDDLCFGVPPGNSKSYAAMYVWYDLGLPFFCDTVVYDPFDHDISYCNQRQYRYFEEWRPEWMIEKDDEPDWNSILDQIAASPRALLFLHPNMTIFSEFWDWKPYRGGNHVEFGKWVTLPERPPAVIERYLGRLKTLVRKLQADPRFKICTLADKLPDTPRTAIGDDDFASILSQYRHGIADVRFPHSWCAYDVFAAAVRKLRGEMPQVPGKAYGFLEEPVSIASSTSLGRADMVAAAKRIKLGDFVPSSIDVGGVKVGPGDFLMAALKLIVIDADKVTIEPSAQYAMPPAPLAAFHPKGTWTHSAEFRDDYASDRLRWQMWTLRRHE